MPCLFRPQPFVSVASLTLPITLLSSPPYVQRDYRHCKQGYAPLAVMSKFRDLAVAGRERRSETSTVTVIDWEGFADFDHVRDVISDQSGYNAWLEKGYTYDQASLKLIGNSTSGNNQWSLIASMRGSSTIRPRTSSEKHKLAWSVKLKISCTSVRAFRTSPCP